MPRVILLGTGSAWSGPSRENTYLLIQGTRTNILVDCAGSPAQRLAQVGVSLLDIDHVILTHTHPDHIYGWPIFALNAWMAGRRVPLNVYALPDTIKTARALLNAVGASTWPDFFKIRYHTFQTNSIDLIFSNREFSISATETHHFVPTIGLRVTSETTGESIAYSCDTSPQETIVELARGVKYLFHEATTLDESSAGHSSATQAGLQAQRAGARELVLLHLPPDVDARKWHSAAAGEFAGRVHVAHDLQSFEF